MVAAQGAGTTATGAGTGPVAQGAGGRTVAAPVAVVMRDAPAASVAVTGTVVMVADIGTAEVIADHVTMTVGRIVLVGTAVVMTEGARVVSAAAHDGMTARAVRVVFARTADRVVAGSTGTGAVVMVGSPAMAGRVATVVGRVVRVDSSVTVVPAVGSGAVRVGSRRTTDRVAAGLTGVLGTPAVSSGTVVPAGMTPRGGGTSGTVARVVGISAMRVEAGTGVTVGLVGTGIDASVTVPRVIGSTVAAVGMTGTSGIGAATVGAADTDVMTVLPVGMIMVRGARPTIGRAMVVAAVPGTVIGGMVTRGVRAVNGATGPGGMMIVAARIGGAARAIDVMDDLIVRVISGGIGRVTVIVAVLGTGTAAGMRDADQMVSTVDAERIHGGMTSVLGRGSRSMTTAGSLTKRVRTIGRSSNRRRTRSTRRDEAMSRR